MLFAPSRDRVIPRSHFPAGANRDGWMNCVGILLVEAGAGPIVPLLSAEPPPARGAPYTRYMRSTSITPQVRICRVFRIRKYGDNNGAAARGRGERVPGESFFEITLAFTCKSKLCVIDTGVFVPSWGYIRVIVPSDIHARFYVFIGMYEYGRVVCGSIDIDVFCIGVWLGEHPVYS